MVFRQWELPYRFGPHGLKFSKEKALKVRITVKQYRNPEGYSTDSLKLYYINRESGRLEKVDRQRLDLINNEDLKPDLTHFSDYVVGSQLKLGWKWH